MAVLSAAAAFCASSITMILINKAAVMVFPFSSLLLILQNVVTVLLLLGTGDTPQITWGRTLTWIPCALLFTLNIFSSLQSLHFLSVPTFTLLRNTQPLLSIVVDFFVRGEKTGLSSMMFLFMVFLGALVYCYHDLGFDLHGYLWGLVHVLSMSFYAVIVRSVSVKSQWSAREMSMCNNLMSLPFLILLAVVERGASLLSWESPCSFLSWCTVILLSSCVGGFWVSVAGLNAQQVMSPTSWLTLNNLSKIPAILLSFLFFGGELSIPSLMGMALSLGAGYLYALCRQGWQPSRSVMVICGMIGAIVSLFGVSPLIGYRSKNTSKFASSVWVAPPTPLWGRGLDWTAEKSGPNAHSAAADLSSGIATVGNVTLTDKPRESMQSLAMPSLAAPVADDIGAVSGRAKGAAKGGLVAPSADEVPPSSGMSSGYSLVNDKALVATELCRPSKTVLVLGSSGLTGAAVTSRLRELGCKVLEVKNRHDVDLRVKGSLDGFKEHIDFCFFLACEVGGSKFIGSSANQQMIQVYNDHMYANVLPFLHKRNIPFLFASSQLSNTDTVYGRVKKDGEARVNASNLGKSFQIWNAFGVEPIGAKSHVLSDWIWQCLKYGRARSLSDGTEVRQFTYANDMAVSLVEMMHRFDSLPKMVHLTTGQWTSMREAAHHVKQALNSTCEITFSDKRAQFQRGKEATVMWKVGSSVQSGLQAMVPHYQQRLQEEQTWKTRAKVYLSVIAACRNDDYYGIRARLFPFLHSFSQVANEANLDYEMILVQYNPITSDYLLGNSYDRSNFDRDLPLSMSFPFSNWSASMRLRIVTVPPKFHVHAKNGPFWEYIAKNVGARQARGKFLLFCNVDVIFPRSMMSWIAKGNLLETRAYRSGRVTIPVGQHGMDGVCDRVSTGKGLCTASKICVQTESFPGVTEVSITPLGDFTIFGRKLFLKTKGWSEIPQAKHVDTGYVNWFTRTYKQVPWVYMDDVICHQDHSRGRVHASVSHQAISRLHPQKEFGLPNATLTQSISDSLLDFGFNPETPWMLYRHHYFFERYKGKLWQGAFDPAMITDFVGTKTDYRYDCDNWFRYRKFHLSRRIPCNRHDIFRKINLSSHGVPVYGELPVLDEEYFEWISLLRAVHDRAAVSSSRPFVIGEFGARYGTWLGRGVRAMLTLDKGVAVAVCGVEGDETGFKWMEQHIARNVPPSPNHKIVRGLIGKVGSSTAAPVWEPGSRSANLNLMDIGQLLSTYSVVDIIHVDIQGSEDILLEASTMGVLNSKVKHLHIGTHGQELHDRLKKGFLDGGWVLNHELLGGGGIPNGRVIATDLGPVRMKFDGEISVTNPKLKGA
jgi:nucleoside-diphosphate-sugar epimerase